MRSTQTKQQGIRYATNFNINFPGILHFYTRHCTALLASGPMKVKYLLKQPIVSYSMYTPDTKIGNNISVSMI